MVYVTASYMLINACRSFWACFLAACFSSLQVRDKKLDFSAACEQFNRRIIEMLLLKLYQGQKSFAFSASSQGMFVEHASAVDAAITYMYMYYMLHALQI